MALAGAGAVLGINPFDQPDVQLAKDLAKKAMAGGSSKSASAVQETLAAQASEVQDALQTWVGQANVGDYFSLQAYLQPSDEVDAALQQLRTLLRSKTRLAGTAGHRAGVPDFNSRTERPTA